MTNAEQNPTPQYPSPQYPSPQYGAYGQLPYAPAPPPPQAYEHPKPGIVPLRPLGLGDVLAGAWSAVWHNPAVMLGLALLIVLLASLLSALFGLALNAPLARWNQDLMNQANLTSVLHDVGLNAGDLGFFTGSSAAAGVLMALVTPIINGILAISISQSVLGNRLSIADAWARVRGRIGALIGWSILMTLALIVLLTVAILAIVGLAIAASNLSEGFAAALAILLSLALIAALLWLSVKLLFVAPIIAIERSTIRQAIHRSWELTRGHFWRILGIYLLGTLLVSIVSNLITLPLTLLTGALNFGTGAVTGVGFGAGVGVGTMLLDIIRIAIANVVSMAFTSGLLTLLYIDARTRGEGLHNSLISATTPAATSW